MEDIDHDLINEIIDMSVEFLPDDKNKLIEDLIERIKYSKLKIKEKRY